VTVNQGKKKKDISLKVSEFLAQEQPLGSHN